MSTSPENTQNHLKRPERPFKKLKAAWQKMTQDLKTVKILRLSLGMTISMAVAFAINWPLAMLTPVFTVVFLSLPMPRPSFQQGFKNMMETLLGLTIGVLFALFLLPYPFVYILMIGLALFYTYYYINRGGSFWFALMTLLSLLLMPMMATTSDGLAIGVSLGFIWSGWVAVWMIFLAHFLIPNPEFNIIPTKTPTHKGYVPVAAELALKSTLVVFPLATLFLVFNLTDFLVLMIMVSIFSLSPDLTKGKEAGMNSLISTLIGGIAAYCFYWLLVAVPEYPFFVVLTFFLSLIFAIVIFSGRSDAKYYSSALTTVIILFSASMGEDKDFTSTFFLRVALIIAAVLYLVVALKVLDRYWPSNKN